MRGRAHDTRPCALAIGGLDPGGGAGLAADLRAFQASGAFGCAVAAVVTVQSTAGLRSVRALDARLVAMQAEEVLRHQAVRAIKIGALGPASNVRTVARLLDRHAGRKAIPIVVDTPIQPTRAASRAPRLTSLEGLSVLKETLLPRATLVTVNAAEAEVLLGAPVRSIAQARDAAARLVRGGLRAVLVKGGHLEGPAAVDVLALGRDVIELATPRLRVGSVHGTGCTLASLIAGRLATRRRRSGRDALLEAVRWAKRVHHAALSRAVSVGGGMRVLCFPTR